MKRVVLSLLGRECCVFLAVLMEAKLSFASNASCTWWSAHHEISLSPECTAPDMMNTDSNHNLIPFLWPRKTNESSRCVRTWDGEGTKEPFPTFLHIAKTAGGTIRHVHFPEDKHPIGQFISKDSALRFMAPGHTCEDGQDPPRRSSSYHRQPTFCVVRHPLARFVSSLLYLHKVNRRHTFESFKPGIFCFAVALLKAEQALDGLSRTGFWPNNSAALDDYNRRWKTDASRNWNASRLVAQAKICNLKEVPRISWCHFIPQSDYVFNEKGERTCSYVLRFEHLEAEFAALAKIYKRSATWRINSTSTESILNDPSVAKKKPTSEKTSSEHLYGLISPEILTDIYEIYEADFRLLGYKKDLHAPPPPPLLAPYAKNQRFRYCAAQRDPRIRCEPSAGCTKRNARQMGPMHANQR